MASESHPPTLESTQSAGFRPEELPPVTPPSAGFIVQLFLIPALIVMAVVVVWALFGKLADSDNDWKQLATELSSSNEHRRWRAALGLAQLLQNEQIYPPKDQEPLAKNPLVVFADKTAQRITGFHNKHRRRHPASEFLARRWPPSTPTTKLCRCWLRA
ncbi:MAG: hypothetical protein WKF77_08135 [Planctomycetaceae bacterium]